MLYQINMNKNSIEEFCKELRFRERSAGTIEQYRRTLLNLWNYLPDHKILDKELLLHWKKDISVKKTPASINCMIAAVNAFLEFTGAVHMKLKTVKRQRKTFSENELTQDEFRALVEQAKAEGDIQTAMLLQTISGTGIRVSEVRYITIEALESRMTIIQLKGKSRQIPLGEKLCRSLLHFAKRQNIKHGPLFVNKAGQPLDRRRIWERMKKLCIGAGVDPQKVYPHALRHLFARAFYALTQDIAKLADMLGHSSIETTRIYIVTSCKEHQNILDQLTSQLGTKKPPYTGGRFHMRT